MRTHRLQAAFLATAVLGLASSPARTEVVDYIAIIVDEDVILMSEVVEKAQQMAMQWQAMYSETLPEQEAVNMAASELVDDMLFKQLARKMHVTISSDQIDNALENQLDTRGITLAEFEEALEAQGMDLETYRNKVIKSQLLRYEVLGLKIGGPKVTEAMARDFYNQQVASVRAEASVEIADILVATPEDADLIQLAEFRKEAEAIATLARVPGADFAALAAERSDDEASAANGGLLGKFSPGDLPEVVEGAVVKLDEGEVSDPVRTSTGYHVILLVKRHAKKVKSFEEAKNAILDQLAEEEMIRQETILLKELRRTTYIQVK